MTGKLVFHLRIFGFTFGLLHLQERSVWNTAILRSEITEDYCKLWGNKERDLSISCLIECIFHLHMSLKCISSMAIWHRETQIISVLCPCIIYPINMSVTLRGSLFSHIFSHIFTHTVACEHWKGTLFTFILNVVNLYTIHSQCTQGMFTFSLSCSHMQFEHDPRNQMNQTETFVHPH